MCVCVCVQVTNAMQDLVSARLGQRFIEPQSADLAVVFADSSPSTPLIFVLSPGTDPAAALYKFADQMKFGKKLSAISLGQGQASITRCTVGGSVAEWLACSTQALKGLGSNRSLDALAVLGKLFTPIVPLFTKQRS